MLKLNGAVSVQISFRNQYQRGEMKSKIYDEFFLTGYTGGLASIFIQVYLSVQQLNIKSIKVLFGSLFFSPAVLEPT